jgi:hypothetical protein
LWLHQEAWRPIGKQPATEEFGSLEFYRHIGNAKL